jgi:hypothetical protein
MNEHTTPLGNAETVRLRLVPINLGDARKFIGQHHRHNLPPVGWRFGVAVAMKDGTVVGVAMAGRPVARMLDDGRTLEVTRTCTLGTPNANSMLYGATARAAKALGYDRLITYTLAEETGSSLRAAGWEKDADVPGEASWSRPSRPAIQTDIFGNERRPPGDKVRWIKRLAA